MKSAIRPLLGVFLVGCGGEINNGTVSMAVTRRISVARANEEGNAASFKPMISPDGRYVAFESTADNLVTGDTNGKRDIFVHELETRYVMRVSLSSTGAEPNADCFLGGVSSDARYIVFWSTATNLVGAGDEGGADTNGQSDVFVRDRYAWTTRRISLSSAEAQAVGGTSNGGSISYDGRYAVFSSYANNLVIGDTNGDWDVFVRDLIDGTTVRVSLTTGGVQVVGAKSAAVISGNGRIVAYQTASSTLHPDDTDTLNDVYVRNWQDASPTTTLVSRSSGTGLPTSVKGNSASTAPSLSEDGSIVAFESFATNLVSDDVNVKQDIFVRDWTAPSPTTRRVSQNSAGQQGADTSLTPVLSGNGRCVLFSSYSPNLVADDHNGRNDVFRHDLLTGTTERISVATFGGEARGPLPGSQGTVFMATMSREGETVVFESTQLDLVAGDENGVGDIFVRGPLR